MIITVAARAPPQVALPTETCIVEVVLVVGCKLGLPVNEFCLMVLGYAKDLRR